MEKMPPRAAQKPRSGKGFNWFFVKFLSVCADSRFGKPRISFGKVLILLVGSCCFGVLIRGLQNLESPFGKDLILLVGSCCLGGLIRGSQNLGTPGKGTNCHFLRCAKSNQKAHGTPSCDLDSKLCRK